MRTLMFGLILSLIAVPMAEASKARMTVVGDAYSLPDDLQELFINPAKAFNVADQLSLEYGPDSEGGWLRTTSENTKFGVYIGHRNDIYDDLVTEAGNGLPLEQNPIELIYAERGESLVWAVSLWASKGRDMVARSHVDSQGLRWGARFGEFEAYAHAALRNHSKIENLITAQMDSQYQLGGEYQMEDMTYALNVQSSRGRISPSGGNDALRGWDEVTLGFEMIEENSEAYTFWGAKIVNKQTKKDPATEVSLKLPFYLGVESKMGGGLQWRAFFEQSILLNRSKNDPGTGFPATADNEGLNDARAALGASYQGGPLRLDGALSTTATTGNLRTDNLAAELSLNYLF